MALNVGSLPVTGVYAGSTEVQQVYVGTVLVWENRETVTITGTQPWEAQDNLRAALTDRGLDYRTVTEIPFALDTSQVTTMNEMFSGCYGLTTVPQMDTSKVTDMNKIFSGCSSLTTVSQMDTSKVENMDVMFSGCSRLTTVPKMDTSSVTKMKSMFIDCAALTSVPDMNTSNVTSMGFMFKNCKAMTDGNVRCIGKKSGVITNSMIDGSGLTRLPFYDTNGNWTG